MKKHTYGIPVLALAALGLTLGACQQTPAPAPVVNVEPSSAPPASPPPSSNTVEHSATTTSSTTTNPHDPDAGFDDDEHGIENVQEDHTIVAGISRALPTASCAQMTAHGRLVRPWPFAPQF